MNDRKVRILSITAHHPQPRDGADAKSRVHIIVDLGLKTGQTALIDLTAMEGVELAADMVTAVRNVVVANRKRQDEKLAARDA